MNKIIILTFMLNSFVFGADINSLIEELTNDTDITSLIKELENEEALYDLLHLIPVSPEFDQLSSKLAKANEGLPKSIVIEKNFKNKKLGKEFTSALNIFINAKNSNNLSPYEFLCEENLMNTIFSLKKDENICENLQKICLANNKEHIRLNQSVVKETMLEEKKISIKKINFRYKNSNNKPVELPKKKFFIFEFSKNEKYLLAMKT